ncbi:hypothetical protein LCGC14_1254740, partial [marine sediment metagenome]
MKKKNLSPIEKEMSTPYNEVMETLPMEEKSYEEALPPQKEEDYLDVDTSQQQTPKTYSQPLMFGDEAKENLIADLLKVDWERVEHIIRGHKP